ncbi:hypothetical protein CBS101457_004415 [Exobasidium rhododendri]|nr:hypothetical protein CBS101457_004415 [Exobasidium rhododendri]
MQSNDSPTKDRSDPSTAVPDSIKSRGEDHANGSLNSNPQSGGTDSVVATNSTHVSPSHKSRDHRETSAGNRDVKTPTKQSSENNSKRRGSTSSETRQTSTSHKSPRSAKDSSPSSSQSSPSSPRKSPSPSKRHRANHSRKSLPSSLDAAGTATQVSLANTVSDPSSSRSSQQASTSQLRGDEGTPEGDGNDNEGSYSLGETDMNSDSVEIEASLSASSSNSSSTNVSVDTTADVIAGRFADDGENTSGEISLSSTGNQPQSLSATLSRGAFHQCGTARRVKVYELKGETWDDRGTGYCAGVYDEKHDAALLVARVEEGCRKLTVSPNGVGNESDEVEGQPLVNESTAAGEENAGIEGKEDREHFMLVVSEDLDKEDLLLKTRVVKEDVYQRQQDTLVVWTEPDGTDMALSFQEADGCHEVWEFLTEVQKHFILNARQASEGLGLDDGDGEGLAPGTLGVSSAGIASDGELIMSDGSSFALPIPNMDSLEVIDLTLKDAASRSPQAREKVAEWIIRDEYLLKLIPVFHDAEDLEQLEELHRLCNIMHTILMLNDSVLVERILRDDIFLGAIGMLEYDPEFPRLKASYRNYLIHTTKFRQVVDIHDASILSKIHQTYRLQYLKDVVLARILDDSTFAILNSIIFYHQADIVTFCTSSEVFLTSLFQIFGKGREESEERKAEAIIFLQQLCAMGKQIQLPVRVALYRTLTEWGLLIVLEYALSRTESRLRNAAAEVLMTITEYDATGIRVHVLDQVEKKATPLITKMSEILHENHGDLGLKTQITESLRILFDSGPDGASGGPNVAQTLAAAAAASNDGGRSQKDDTDRFLNWFYDGEVDHLFSPLKNLTTFKELMSQQTSSSNSTKHRTNVIDITSPSKSALFNHLCDLLTFIIIHHHFRSQYWVISSDISIRVATLLFAREKHLRLTALRFFRACLSKGNQFINRHFLKIELVSAVLAVVEGESKRDNLVTSACLDFFEHIRKENMRALIAHLMERHEARVRALTEHSHIGHYFQALILQWEKNIEPLPSSSALEEGESTLASVSDTAEKERRLRDIDRRGGNRATMDSDEENYFNGEEDDDDDEEEDDREHHSFLDPSLGSQALTKSSTPGSGLVSYLADEEGEEEGEEQQSIDTKDEDEDNFLSSKKESPSLSLSKRKKREAEEDEDDDMMGRLAKRKSHTNDAGEEADLAQAGGFIKEDDDQQSDTTSRPPAASKRFSINLSFDSKKTVKKDKE